MKKILLLVCAGMVALPLVAQRDKAKPLATADPLVGCWKYVEDGKAPSVMFGGDSTRYLWLGCCGAETMAAQTYDMNKKNFALTSSFVVHSDGKSMYGKIFRSALDGKEGLEISFRYKYNKGKDQLLIIQPGETYVFQRINPSTLEPVKPK